MIGFEKLNNKRREFTDKLLSPLIYFLYKNNIQPNFLSFLNAFCLIISAYFINIFEFKLSTLFMLLCGFFDILDGGLARKYKVKRFGHIVDSFVDNSFSNFLTIALFSINYIEFPTLIFSVASLFFYNLSYNQYKLYMNKSPKCWPLPIPLFTFFSFFMNNVVTINLMFLIVALVTFVNSIFIFIKIKEQ